MLQQQPLSMPLVRPGVEEGGPKTGKTHFFLGRELSDDDTDGAGCEVG